MSITGYPSLIWDDIAEGADLPGFDYELSMLRLVAFVRATGLYDYVHHDSDYARAVGIKDAFAATPHIGGLTPGAIEHQSMETVAQTEALFQGRMPAGAVNAAHAYRLSGFAMPTDAR